MSLIGVAAVARPYRSQILWFHGSQRPRDFPRASPPDHCPAHDVGKMALTLEFARLRLVFVAEQNFGVPCHSTFLCPLAGYLKVY